MSDLLDLSAFQDQLTNSATAPRDENGEDSLRLQKVTMSSRDYLGKIFFVPVIPKSGSLPWIHFTRPTSETDNRTYELKLWSEDYEDFVWHKLLPKVMYPDLTPEESALYDEISSMWQFANDDEITDFNTAKRGNYSFCFGKVLNHYNVANEVVEKTSGKMSLLVFPSASVASKLKENTDSVTLMSGNNAWLNSVYNNNLTERTGCIKVSFTKGASMGYDIVVEHLFNNGMVNPVATDFAITPEEMNLCDNLITRFLGFNQGKDRLWNNDHAKFMKSELERMIKEASPEEAQATDAAPVQNMNQTVDPMLGGGQPPVQTPTTETPVGQVPPTNLPPTGHVDPITGMPTTSVSPPPSN